MRLADGTCAAVVGTGRRGFLPYLYLRCRRLVRSALGDVSAAVPGPPSGRRASGGECGVAETNERKSAAKGRSEPVLELRQAGSVCRWLADDLLRV